MNGVDDAGVDAVKGVDPEAGASVAVDAGVDVVTGVDPESMAGVSLVVVDAGAGAGPCEGGAETTGAEGG